MVGRANKRQMLDENVVGPRTETTTNDIAKLIKDQRTMINDGFKNLKDEIKDEIKLVKATVDLIQDSIKNVESKVQFLESKVEVNSENLKAQRNEIEILQQQVKKLNVVIVGMTDFLNETEEELRNKLQDLFSNSLEINNRKIHVDVCYRMGRFSAIKQRNILVKFNTESDRKEVMEKRNLLKEKKLRIYINEDLTKSVLLKRKLLREECTKLRLQGKNASVKGNFLVIENKKYIMEEGIVKQLNANYNTAPVFKTPLLFNGASTSPFSSYNSPTVSNLPTKTASTSINTTLRTAP